MSPSSLGKLSVSIPRDHHYVPVFYLKQWAGTDGRLCEYKRVPGKIVTHRKVPKGTGFERDLYRVDGLPDALAQVVESTFMRMVDTEASAALGKIVCGDPTPWDAKMRSGWTRFILSLRFRNPEAVSVIKRQILDVWEAGVDNLRTNYDKLRRATDPARFEEYMALTEPQAPCKAALIFLQDIINSPRVGPTIFGMHWSGVSVAASCGPLLTSDRPLDMSGLGSKDAYIALPVGPKMLFIAGHDDTLARRLASIEPTKVVTKVNEVVVQQARRLVWGLDNKQLRFVQNRMSKTPDRPVISEEQKQRAINATAGRWT